MECEFFHNKIVTTIIQSKSCGKARLMYVTIYRIDGKPRKAKNFRSKIEIFNHLKLKVSI